jgi:hypothetical protein
MLLTMAAVAMVSVPCTTGRGALQGMDLVVDPCPPRCCLQASAAGRPPAAASLPLRLRVSSLIVAARLW